MANGGSSLKPAGRFHHICCSKQECLSSTVLGFVLTEEVVILNICFINRMTIHKPIATLSVIAYFAANSSFKSYLKTNIAEYLQYGNL